jgi:hypothetical protein
VAETLTGHGAETRWSVLSLGAGDGRDLLPELANTNGLGIHAVLVEHDQTLAREARAITDQLGVDGATIITGDAGETATFASALPVDLLLLCGIFGNISEHDVAATVAATPAMLRPGGTVIWTRGSRQPDLRPQIRQWFSRAGLHEVAFDNEPEGFGVGVAALTTSPTPPLQRFRLGYSHSFVEFDSQTQTVGPDHGILLRSDHQNSSPWVARRPARGVRRRRVP